MYLGIFTDKQDIVGEFRLEKDALEDANILLAWYDYEDYEGQAFVLFERNNQLYEAHGGHCSCFGLEDQWDPEETSFEALRFRRENGRLGYFSGHYSPELDSILAERA